jgi:hypothetical protein
MSSSKHDKGQSPFPDDLDRNPGIGQSPGGTRAEDLDGENTIEGDVDNDVDQRTGGVPESLVGRTNS